MVLVAASGSRVTGLEAARSLAGYRVVYSIVDRAVAKPHTRTQVVEVRRPYDARVEERAGSPPGQDVTSGQVSNREFSWQLEEGGRPQFGWRRPPGGAGRDISYGALRDAERAGVIDAVGQGVALGRRCTWFASENPFPQVLAPPTRASRVETCVDAAGVMLEEAWFVGGRLARTIEASSVRIGRPDPERFFEGVKPSTRNVSQPEAMGLLSAQYVVADDVDVRAPRLRFTAPAGWRLDRRSAVVEATPVGGQPSERLAVSYRMGSTLVVVELALQPDLQPSWPSTEGEKVAVGDNDGRLAYYSDRVELRMLTGPSGFARVIAPDRALATAFARRVSVRD